MTITIDAPDVDVDFPDQEDETVDAPETKRGRDFSKFRPVHQELADYVNARSGLDPITANQVKALLALRAEFSKSPEQAAAREQRKAEREAAKSRYAGMTPDQIKAAKAADRAERQAARLEARVAEAKAKAEALRSSATASGEDLAAAVEAAQSDEGDEGKRRIGRRK